MCLSGVGGRGGVADVSAGGGARGSPARTSTTQSQHQRYASPIGRHRRSVSSSIPCEMKCGGWKGHAVPEYALNFPSSSPKLLSSSVCL